MPAKKWTDETIRQRASEYSSLRDFRIANEGAYCAAKDRFPGLLTEIFSVVKWTEENVIKEAKKYKTKREFDRGCTSAYQAALNRYKWILDELFDSRYNLWTEPRIREEAKKYKNRVEFCRANPSAQMAAYRKYPGLMDEMFPISRARTDNDTIYIWKAIGEYYNGNPVYKVGVTSYRLGRWRIEEVAIQSGFYFEIICFERVVGKASKLEKKLKALGENPKYIYFNGSTEFRALSDSALYTAISIIADHTRRSHDHT